ncbi:MAG: DUF2752 domain-containing protein [Burkholderiales bacterium]|jgi:hypothetical protein|nr:DUF2752 domain-containing protein [Burkholderiales bacterium]
MADISSTSGLLSPPERQWRSALALGWPLALLGAPLVLSLGDMPLCGFRHMTGLPCPFCGGTRACAALADGNLLMAWHLNPGLMVLLALAAAHSVQLGFEAWTGRRVQRWRMGADAWRVGLFALSAGWVLRLVGLV